MGHFSCFVVGRKKKGLIRNNAQNKDQNTHSKTSDTSSVIMNEQLEKKLDPLVSKDDDRAESNSMTFSYRELATATNNFRHESLIGEGGFGAVYKGKLETTDQIVAVKKLNHSGLQGEKEFLVEVLMLSLLRHSNLVNLIGYCAEGEQRLLVYEFMPLGSLEDQLYDLRPECQPLDWNTRMMIAAGAAKGLNFLHNEADPPVIYRDLKSSNILLDEGFYPKLSDFGLAKFGPDDDRSHVSTRVMGTQGYCAPEYAGTGKLTIKSDVYSFGVVLLELITGRRPLDMTRGVGKHMLVDWARPLLRDRKNRGSLADPLLKGEYPERSFCSAVELALMCLREDAHARPNMKDVVLAMNYLTCRQKHGADTSRADGQGQRDVHDPEEETRSCNKSEDRQRAVAEAKMWGETWRDRGRQHRRNVDGDLNR